MLSASYALLLKLQKALFFAIERDRDFCLLFCTQPRPNVFVSDAWPAPATYHRPFCERCDQRGVGAPNERAPFRFHGAVLVLSIDVCRGPSPLRNNIWLSFSLTDLGPTSAQIFFFPVFVQPLEPYFEDLCSKRAVQKSWRVSLTFIFSLASVVTPVFHLRDESQDIRSCLLYTSPSPRD